MVPELLLRTQEGMSAITFTRQGRDALGSTLDRWLSLTERLLAGTGIASAPAGSLTQTTSLPSRSAWLRLAQKAARATRGDGLEKVVLARYLAVRGDRNLDPGELIDTLERDYPACRIFAARFAERVLVSASPERLVSRSGDLVTCDAIGGTIRRTEDPSKDRALAHRMLADPKTRREHQLVVDALTASLAAVCSDLDLPQRPDIFRLRGLLHLWTELRARVSPRTSLLDLVRSLHPTPAVNGTPRDTALQWLRAHEPFQRGWYAGGGGWLDTDGDGEVAVLLRCALLHGDSADLYAGAGIVGDSDAETEYAETELKLGAILRALQSEAILQRSQANRS
jgi:menaquinone-specific isochorismate synthase